MHPNASRIQISESDANLALAHAPTDGKSLSVRLDGDRFLLIADGLPLVGQVHIELHAHPLTPDGRLRVDWKIRKPFGAFAFSGPISDLLRQKIATIPALASAVVEVTKDHILLDPARLRFGALTLGDHAQILSLTLAPPSGAAVELTFRLK